MSGKTLVLITGGNNGLGYYAAQQLAASGDHHVIIGSRDVRKGEAAVQSLINDSSYHVDPADVETIEIDVNSDDSLVAAARAIEQKHGRLDIFLSNAGVSQMPSAETLASLSQLRASFRYHYETNVFGASLAVEAFLPLLRRSTHPRGKRIAFTSSGLSSLTFAANDGPFDAKYAHVYRSSKTALNMLMLYYARSLQDEGFVVAASDPGYCATDLNAHRGLKDPRDGAKVLIRAATDVKEKVHGFVVDENATEAW